MVIRCKICRGSGRAGNSFFGPEEVCPSCRGAGEFEFTIAKEKVVTCRFCKGNGLIVNLFDTVACPACKGIGLLERPLIGPPTAASENQVTVPHAPRLPSYEYDIAVSFAGEDRELVKKYCDLIISRGLKVFYDEYHKVSLWGANLYDRLDEVYRKSAIYCVIFISKFYKEKVWTNHERKSAQGRALQENREYVLPVKLDETEIEGIPPTVAHVDLREISIGELADMTISKVSGLKRKAEASQMGSPRKAEASQLGSPKKF